MLESEVRDFIVTRFSPFTDYIANHGQFDNDLDLEKDKIIKGGTNPSKVFISDLIKLTVIDKLKLALPVLTDLKLIDKEFNLLKTQNGRGKQPSVDIMAFNELNYCLALIELKVSDSTEREAVTELSAYNQGLQNKFRGLSSLEVIWIPISTDWRVTTKSAIEFEMIWQNTLVMPLKMQVTYDSVLKQVNNVVLECFNPASDLSEIECINLFSYECFVAFDYCTKEEIPDKEAFINYVTAICSRQKINGFILFHEPVDMMFPYGFTLCIYNPYKGYLHRQISQDFITKFGEHEYNSAIKKSGVINPEFYDIDFKTDEIKHFEPKDSDMEGTSLKYGAFWDKDFLSVGDFSENTENPNISFLIDKINQMLDSNGVIAKTFGMPDFESLFTQLKESTVDSVMYLGVHLEIISKRIMLEHQRGLRFDDFFITASSFSYLKDLFEEVNLR